MPKLFLLHRMATAGYSGTPLLKKLGIKPEMKLLLINQPETATSKGFSRWEADFGKKGVNWV